MTFGQDDILVNKTFGQQVFVRIGWKSLSGTDTLAYYKNSLTAGKGFITLGPGVNFIKHFWHNLCPEGCNLGQDLNNMLIAE
jgi:hypothetical protein